MEIIASSSDDIALLEIGERIARYRLHLNLTQAQLAREAGVSLSTITRMESGHSSQSLNLVRVLRALGLLANLEALLPESGPSPLQQLKLQGKQRQRASGSRAEVAEPGWSWDFEQNSTLANKP